MKFNKRTRMMVSAMLVGIASLGAVAAYFDVDWSEWGGYLLMLVLLIVGIVALAAVAVALIKLPGYLMRRQRGTDEPSDSE